MDANIGMQVERVALKMGGGKKKGAAGPASVTLTFASLPGIRWVGGWRRLL